MMHEIPTHECKAVKHSHVSLWHLWRLEDTGSSSFAMCACACACACACGLKLGQPADLRLCLEWADWTGASVQPVSLL